MITVPVKRCCRAVLVGERCPCANGRRQLRRAPVIWITAGTAP